MKNVIYVTTILLNAIDPTGSQHPSLQGGKASTFSITGGPHYFSCHWLFGPPTSEPRTLVGKELACTTVIVTDSKQTLSKIYSM